LPLAIAVLKVKGPLAVIDRLSPELSCKTSPLPVRPVTVPPMVSEEKDEDEDELPVPLGVPPQPNRTTETVIIKSDFLKVKYFEAIYV
jgi:hypothetical protein